MYTQAIDSAEPAADDTEERGPSDAREPRYQAEFDARLARGEFIEAKDWMPEAYRKTLVRQISQHAHSEIVGMLPEGNWITRAPTLEAQGHPARQGAGRRRARPVPVRGRRDAGRVARRADRSAARGKAKYSSIFNYPTLTWADIGVIGWLVDGAAIMNQIPLTRCSYGPYARAMIRICKEESFHQRQGFDLLLTMMRGSQAQRDMVQDAVNRWWWPSLMMFGPHDSESQHGDAEQPVGHQAHLQRRPAPEVRRRDGAAGPGARRRPCPTRTCKWNEARGHWDFGEIDWAEFWDVVNGHGPCNRERLAERVKAHEDGAWVREAALAYAAKQEQRLRAA